MNSEAESLDPRLDEILPFAGGGSFPVQYEVDIEDANYYVRYRGGWLSIDKNDVEVFEQCLNQKDELDGEWNDEETTVYLYLISKAVASGDFGALALRDKDQVKTHPLYVPGLQPVYVSLDCDEDHDHDMTKCPVVQVSPMDLARRRDERASRQTLPQRMANALKRLSR